MNSDLHTHTVHSDGLRTPTELVREASELGLKVIALTDHNAVSGNDEAIEAGKRYGVEVIPGCEIACEEGEVLAYFIDYRDEGLLDFLKEVNRFKRDHRVSIVNKLNDLELSITVEEIEDKYGKLNRANIALTLADKGYAENMRDAFEKYMAEGKPAYCEFIGFKAIDVVRAIKKAKGLAVLAHPWLCGFEQYKKGIVDLVNAGLDGIEVSGFAKNELYEESIQWSRRIADEYNLILVSGSDYHGEVHPNKLGEFACDYSVVEEMKKRAKRKV